MDDKELDKLFGMGSDDNGSGEKETSAGKPEPAKEAGSPEDKKKDPEKAGEPSKDDDRKDEDKEEPEAKAISEESEENREDKEEPEEEEERGGKEEKREENKPARKPIKKRAPENKPVFVKDKEPGPEISLRDRIPLSNSTIAIFVLGLAFITMVLCVLFLPAFRVRTVNIEGNVVLSDEEVLSMTGLEYNAHLFSGVSGNIIDILCLNYGKTEQQIMEKNPYVESITISVKLPSTVNIQIKERQKIAYIKTADGYLAIDRDGIVLELSSAANASDVRPVICGMQFDGAKLGEKLTIKNINGFKKAIIVLGAILNADNASVGGDYNMFENTSEVRILPSGYIFLTIYSPSGNMVQIKLNDMDSIDDDMAWLLYAFNANAFDQVTSSGALDMTGDEYIYQEYK